MLKNTNDINKSTKFNNRFERKVIVMYINNIPTEFNISLLVPVKCHPNSVEYIIIGSWLDLCRTINIK